MYISRAERRPAAVSNAWRSVASGNEPHAQDPRCLANWLLERREKALRAGLTERAEQLLCLAWEAFDRA